MSVTELQLQRTFRTGFRWPLNAAWIPVAGALLGAGWGSNQFTPMLLVYHARLGLPTSSLEALFGAYAAGLIPGLLLAGWWSDRHGRRPLVIASAALSLLASVSLIAGAHAVVLLFLGRLLAGLGSGAAFGVGTAWLREASLPPFGDAAAGTVARRAAVAMTTGFALGPLVAGMLAQWAPGVNTTPYLPHIALMLAVLAGLRGVPETIGEHEGRRARVALPRASARRFRRVVVPMAPWVFAAPAIAFALLPSIVIAGNSPDGVAVTAAITSLTALAGVLIQPVARRLEAGARGPIGGTVGLLVLAVALVLAALAVDVRQTWLLAPCAILFGAAYGLCLVAGLLEVQRLAPERALGVVTSSYYAVMYTGFAAPFVLTLASSAASYAVLLLVTSGLAIMTALGVREGARTQAGAREGVRA